MRREKVEERKVSCEHEVGWSCELQTGCRDVDTLGSPRLVTGCEGARGREEGHADATQNAAESHFQQRREVWKGQRIVHSEKKNDAKEKKWKVWMHRREPGCMREERENSVVRRRVWRLQTGCLAPSVPCSVSVVTCTHTCTRICAKKKRKTKRLTDAGHLPDPRKRSWRYRHLSPAGQQSPRAQYRQHTSWCVTPSLSCACACGCG